MLKGNGLRQDITFTESGDSVIADYPKYDNTSGTLYASERNRLKKNLTEKNNRLAQTINQTTSSFNTMSDITYLERIGKILRIYFTISGFVQNDYDIKYSSWSGDSPSWTKDTDVKYLTINDLYKLPVAGLISEINASDGGVSPSITAVGEKKASIYASGGQVDVFRAYMDSSSGADAWKTDVSRIRRTTATRVYEGSQNLGVASTGIYYAVTGNRMNVDTIRSIINNVQNQNGDASNDTGNLNQTAPNSNPPVSSQSGNNGSSSTAPSNGQSGNTSGTGSGNGTKPEQDGIKGNGDSSGDVDKDDDAGQTAAASAAAPNYLVFGLIAAAVAAGFFFIILLKRRKEEDEQ